MSRTLRALVATLLLVEITAVFLGTSTWAILSEMHASMPFIWGGEALAALGVIAVAVTVFKRAIEAERRIDAGVSSEA